MWSANFKWLLLLQPSIVSKMHKIINNVKQSNILWFKTFWILKIINNVNIYWFKVCLLTYFLSFKLNHDLNGEKTLHVISESYYFYFIQIWKEKWQEKKTCGAGELSKAKERIYIFSKCLKRGRKHGLNSSANGCFS